ncbi:hypothetical protein Hanom_Chr05g00475901 [Helianthus anomalus]
MLTHTTSRLPPFFISSSQVLPTTHKDSPPSTLVHSDRRPVNRWSRYWSPPTSHHPPPLLRRADTGSDDGGLRVLRRAMSDLGGMMIMVEDD